MDRNILKFFLSFGYYLDYENTSVNLDISQADKSLYENWDTESLVREAAGKYITAVDKLFVPGKKHAVALSGGFDSRAVLALLLRFTESRNITTYTFGTPGTWDYDIGSQVARRAGTRHIQLPLTEYEYSLEKEIEYSRRTDNQIYLFHHPPLEILDDETGGMEHWSGFFGGRVSGTLQYAQPSSDIESAVTEYLNVNRFVTSVNLSHFSAADINEYLIMPPLPKEQVSLDEQIDFYNRQLKYTALSCMWHGLDWNIPFIDKDLVGFMLSVPREYRLHQKLYISMLAREFKELFMLKTKNYLGLTIEHSNLYFSYKRVLNKLRKNITRIIPNMFDPGVNFINFNQALRNRPDLKNLVKQCLDDLKKRHLVDSVDIDRLWNDHQNGKTNRADALMILASLEIHCKAGKTIEGL